MSDLPKNSEQLDDGKLVVDGVRLHPDAPDWAVRLAKGEKGVGIPDRPLDIEKSRRNDGPDSRKPKGTGMGLA